MAFLRGRTTTLMWNLRRTFSSSPTSLTETKSKSSKMADYLLTHDLASQIGTSMPISMMRIGTIIHNIELRPNEGGKLVRSAGTSAKILKEPSSSRRVLVRLPSGVDKLIDTRCRATIGAVSNPSHGAKKLKKAGNSRWLGRRPVVRGVAMNPIDHPHGGGEGKSKGHHSVSPWGKPTKGGYKTACPKKKNRLI
ncbi:60S ribosomal protein L2, mitochondrial-like [Amaranthus tricolor]|uniref:60S ribosomal protein L2, mitochondrial-like n=1 Tax=Amaranthus tricolor TaxID=29722 RepID=UPI00258AE80E|nr:60S ribosomal protein L2, mitochondrial-like [Amaranthus tricolor]